MNKNELLYKEETFIIIGCCMEVHKTLGKGFQEIVYQDALEIEFKRNKITYEREKEFLINYKGIYLPRKYKADFILFDKIIVELKAIANLSNEEIKHILNYLAVSKMRLGLLINFGEDSLKYKRIIL